MTLVKTIKCDYCIFTMRAETEKILKMIDEFDPLTSKTRSILVKFMNMTGYNISDIARRLSSEDYYFNHIAIGGKVYLRTIKETTFSEDLAKRLHEFVQKKKSIYT